MDRYRVLGAGPGETLGKVRNPLGEPVQLRHRRGKGPRRVKYAPESGIPNRAPGSIAIPEPGPGLSTVVSDLFGVSGRAMLDALVASERNPRSLADLARGTRRGR